MGYLFAFPVYIDINSHYLKSKIMKNAFKVALVALAVSMTVVACESKKSTSGSDTTTNGSTTVVTDTTKKDTSVKSEPVKKDTVVTTETKKTETKKM